MYKEIRNEKKNNPCSALNVRDTEGPSLANEKLFEIK